MLRIISLRSIIIQAIYYLYAIILMYKLKRFKIRTKHSVIYLFFRRFIIFVVIMQRGFLTFYTFWPPMDFHVNFYLSIKMNNT